MIHSVEMVNWRIYERRTFSFQPGITFLMGLNGRGKTSILEAINYALTGEPATVRDRRKLLRNAGQSATVRLVFSQDSERYLIERSQSAKRAESAYLKRLRAPEADEVLASSQGAVTRQTEKLLGVSADFLQRIIYMSEGDVFRFVSRPPREALNEQIRRVLALTELDEFIRALKQVDKEIREHIKVVEGLVAHGDRLVRDRGADEAEWRQYAERAKTQKLAELRLVEERIARCRRESEELQRLGPVLDRALTATTVSQEVLGRGDQLPLLEMLGQVDSLLTQADNELHRAEVELAGLQGEQRAFQETLDLLAPLKRLAETSPCPVCGKPLTHDEAESLRKRISTELEVNVTQQGIRREHIEQARQSHDRLKGLVSGLNGVRNFLDQGSAIAFSGDETLATIGQVAANQMGAIGSQLIALQQEASGIEDGIRALDQENAEYAALSQRLEYQAGYGSLEEARQGLIELETRLLSLQAAERAAQQVLRARRDVDMDVIYHQVETVWAAFAGRGSWQVRLDEEGLPLLEDDAKREFDLSQFSGGEKTALLVILHTIIAQHFSDTDFLLIDEPLEHLDAINRRSLVQFLVNAYRGGRFRQAIVATFEESLIRKYMSDEDVNVIHL